jgi:hypothetical protein
MQKKLAEALRKTGHPLSIEKAKVLENKTAGVLNFRSLGLSTASIQEIAAILKDEKTVNTEPISSISFSYNNLMGDDGAIALASSLPASINEIGLVNCGIGDAGGSAILECIAHLPRLRMICIEQNNFSDELRSEYMLFRKENPTIIVVF